MGCRAKSALSTVISASVMTLVLGSGATASAQSTSGAAAPPSPAPTKWEFDVHFGGAFGSQPTGGTAIGTFPVGESFTAPLTGGSSRYASTWYFGDGARLLNQIAAGFIVVPTSTRIQTLDPVLTRTGIERKRGLSFGGRVSRRLTSRLSAEFNVDSVARTINLTGATLTGVEATRASFGPVWNAIIATGAPLFVDPGTSSTTALSDGTRSRDTALTGALNIELSPQKRLVPYLTAGGGVLLRSGDLPTATLTGNYQFRFVGLAPLNESDVVKVHFASKDSSPVGVFGGGIKYALSGRQGVRLDLRVHVSRNSLDTLVDAQPARVTGSPAFSIPSFTVPALVFSNTSATRSSFSGPAIADLKTFTGSGNDLQSSLTVGYFVRFGAVPLARAVSAPSRAPAAAPTGAKWELGAHLGGGFGKPPAGGTPIGAFPAGESFVAGGRSGRYASTWYFGDGALLIGQIGSGFTGTAAATTDMTPLDPVLTAASLERKRGAGAGVRLARRVTRIVGAEFSIDTMAGSLKLTDTALSGIEATRASFTPMWNAILATGPTVFLSRNVSSITTLTDRVDSRQTFVTGAATFELPSKGRVTPYATAGAGVLFRSGDLPTATLTGNYQFLLAGTFPFNETDVVKVHFTAKDSMPVGLIGGGVKYAVSSRQGVRADVRVHVGANSLDTLVDARPSVALATPGVALFSGTTPPLVLSNMSLARSVLTGPAITDLKTFTGSGREIQTSLTVGYFVRF